MVNDEWRTTSIRNLGVLYAIPDTVSLLLVERMALTTRIHHLCVIVFMVINLFNDYSERNVWRALVVYAVFSTFAYLVNLLLASRFLAAHAHARASTIRTPTLCTSLLLPLAAPWPLPLPSLHTACSPRPPLSPTSLATACAQVHPSLSYWLSAGTAGPLAAAPPPLPAHRAPLCPQARSSSTRRASPPTGRGKSTT